MFGAKPDAPGLSLKGAASAFPAANGSTNLFAFGATTNGNGAASAAGSMNKKWTNPDLAKKDDATNGAPAPATNGTPANIFGTGASTPTGIFGGASTAFGQPANGAAAKPNPFQTGPVEPSPSTPKSTFGAPAFGQPGGLFGGGANGTTSPNSSAAGAAPTPTAWVPPVADNPFSPTSSMFGGRGPPGVVAAGARSRSRSSRPPTRPPR
ncbi:hypothetical protein DL93DRAFT_2076308 [Clavulina sp. PMI_390]|nr:hypothetical protein DL93DRAFT_2076308 [Clavulina sp. PMI_390]